MYSINHPQLFNQDIFNKYKQGQSDDAATNPSNSGVNEPSSSAISNGSNNMSNISQGGIGSLNQYPRKNSIFDHANFQMTSPTSKNSSLDGNFNNGLTKTLSLNNSNPNSNQASDDPFELNSSIWNSNQQQQQQQTPNQVQQQQPQPFQKFHSVSNASTSNASPGFSLNPHIGVNGQRRASYNDYIQPPGNKFNTNYTIWSNNNMIDDYTNNLMLQQQQAQQQAQQQGYTQYQQAQANFNQQQQQNQQHQQQMPQQGFHGDSGFLLSPRRDSYNSNSLDSPGFIPQSLLQHNSQGSFDLLDEQLQNTNLGPYQQINETTPLFTNAYQSVDFYFTQDIYNRVSIKDYSIQELNSTLEKLVTSGIKNAQLPRFSGSSLPSTQLILIAFKSGRVDVFYLPDNSSLILKIGDLVVVEADRGRDLGKIVKLDVSIDEARLLKYLQHQEQQAALASFDHSSGSVSSSNGLNSSPPPSSSGNNHESISPPPNSNNQGSNNVPTLHFPKPIVRFAMPNEVYQIVNKQNDEEKAKKICQLKISSSNLSMNVIDAEYQWDRRKLTFYYNASHRIDFRDLVRELFRIYKTRIWMCAVGSDVKDPNAPPLLSHEEQVQQDVHEPQHVEGLNHGFNWMDKRDVNMFIPRQFNSDQ